MITTLGVFMAYEAPFPKDELDQRIAKVRNALAANNLDGIVIAVPENIYYLTGLDHWGFFAAMPWC